MYVESDYMFFFFTYCYISWFGYLWIFFFFLVTDSVELFIYGLFSQGLVVCFTFDELVLDQLHAFMYLVLALTSVQHNRICLMDLTKECLYVLWLCSVLCCCC